MTQPARADTLTDEAVRRVLDALRGIRFGAVEITIHEGRVVQIERTEKLRLTSPGPAVREPDRAHRPSCPPESDVPAAV